MKFQKGAHTIYKTQYHIVLVTKYRRKILVKGVEEYLEIELREVRKFRPDIEYIETGMDKDHVHLHMVIPPKYAVSEVVNAMKVNTSTELKRNFHFSEKCIGERIVYGVRDFSFRR